MVLRSKLPTALLLTTLLAAACGRGEAGELSCEVVDEHIRTLALPAAPSSLSQAEQIAYADALVAAGTRLTCGELTAQERACALQAETLNAAVACHRAEPAALTVVHQGEQLIGPTAAPPLPLPALSRVE